MNEVGRQPVELTLEQMVERYREQKLRGRELVKDMIHEAAEREREKQHREPVLAPNAHGDAIEQVRLQPLPCSESPTVHHTELPSVPPAGQLHREWNFYRREVGRLLAEGEEGRFVLIEGEEIIGIYDTLENAEAVALHRYPLLPRLIRQIRRYEDTLRGPTRFWRCPG